MNSPLKKTEMVNDIIKRVEEDDPEFVKLKSFIK
jgi:hypothetical protein